MKAVNRLKRENICPNCQKADFDIIGPIKKTDSVYKPECNLVKCKRCKLIWVNPLPDETKFSNYFQDNDISHNNFNIFHLLFWKLYSFELNHEYKLIQNYKNHGVIIDIGVGKGEFLSRFSDEKWEKNAYDPYLAKKDVQDLQRRIGLVKVNEFSNLRDYPANSFDVVILRNVIEHTAGFLSLINNSYRLLKKSGILFIRTPNMDSFDFKVFKASWYVIGMDDHFVFFERKTLLNTLEKSRFRVKLNESVIGSSALCLFRSVNAGYPLPIRLISSVLYSLVSPFLGEGADFRMIAQK